MYILCIILFWTKFCIYYNTIVIILSIPNHCYGYNHGKHFSVFLGSPCDIAHQLVMIQLHH